MSHAGPGPVGLRQWLGSLLFTGFFLLWTFLYGIFFWLASLLLPFRGRFALARFIARPEGLSLAAANKRIANILRKSADNVNQLVDPQRLREQPERALHETLEALRARVIAATAERQYAGALELLATLKPAVDHFFERVLVNDPDPSLRANRLALLLQLRTLFGGIADLSRLPG